MKDLSMDILALFAREEIESVSISNLYSRWDTIIVKKGDRKYRIEISLVEEEESK